MQDRLSKIMQVIEKVRKHPDYQVTVVEHGFMNEKIRAIPINGTDVWEELAWIYSDLQAEVDEAAKLITQMVVFNPTENNATVCFEAIRMLSTAGVRVEVDIDANNIPKPITVFGVFEVDKDLHFAF